MSNNTHTCKGTTPVIIPCSQIYAYTDAPVLTKWALYSLDGTLLYISNRYKNNQLLTLNLTTLSLMPNAQFKLKAVVTAGSDSLSHQILEYVPDCKQSAYYTLTGSTSNTSLTFKGTVPNNL